MCVFLIDPTFFQTDFFQSHSELLLTPPPPKGRPTIFNAFYAFRQPNRAHGKRLRQLSVNLTLFLNEAKFLLNFVTN